MAPQSSFIGTNTGFGDDYDYQDNFENTGFNGESFFGNSGISDNPSLKFIPAPTGGGDQGGTLENIGNSISNMFSPNKFNFDITSADTLAGLSKLGYNADSFSKLTSEEQLGIQKSMQDQFALNNQSVLPSVFGTGIGIAGDLMNYGLQKEATDAKIAGINESIAASKERRDNTSKFKQGLASSGLSGGYIPSKFAAQ